MSQDSNYISTNRSKHYLKCLLIFVCKYRKKLLTDQLKEDMKSILQAIANRSDFDIELFESDIDHIHFLIRYIPRLSISSIVRRLKQELATAIWKKHPSILKRNFDFLKVKMHLWKKQPKLRVQIAYWTLTNLSKQELSSHLPTVRLFIR